MSNAVLKFMAGGTLAAGLAYAFCCLLAMKTMSGATMFDPISYNNGLVDGGEADGVASSDEMVALMNNHALLMQSSTGGSLMSQNNRDADGTVDRSPPPTPEVQKLLKEVKRGIDRYGIDMILEFRTQGATQYGTITKSRFNSILTTTFSLEKNFFWDDAKLNIINKHYGTGAKDIALGGQKQVAWMDFCEDLGETDGSFAENAEYLKGYGGFNTLYADSILADEVVDPYGKKDYSGPEHL